MNLIIKVNKLPVNTAAKTSKVAKIDLLLILAHILEHRSGHSVA
jgi:hypothetical protein